MLPYQELFLLKSPSYPQRQTVSSVALMEAMYTDGDDETNMIYIWQFERFYTLRMPDSYDGKIAKL